MCQNEVEYSKLYHFLAREADRAITELEEGAINQAENRLQRALLQCEEMYLQDTEE